MTANLLSIASSGLIAAQAGLDVTAQNIANAGTEGYVRRTVSQTELATPSYSGGAGEIALSGVAVTGITRNVDAFLQSEARRTGSDSARADGTVTNLQNVDNAVEQSGVFTQLTQFQNSLSQLSANPTDSSLRAGVLASAQDLAQSFNLANRSLADAAKGMQTDAGNGVSLINTLAQGLAKLNQQIASNTDPATTQSGLLDQRDTMLQQLSQVADITTTFSPTGAVTVQLGGASGPQLVNGGTTATMATSTASDSTISFTLGGSAINVTGGSLAADQQGLSAYAGASSQLDAIASYLVTVTSNAQTSGAALDGSAGQPMFTGSGAGNIAVAITSGDQIATAAAGSAAGSQDTTNLTALQNALSGANFTGQTNSLIFALSSAVSSAATTKTALDAIATKASTQLSAQSGVDLNQEAATMLQYQQAFQASGKVIQTAATLFNQLLQIS